MLSIASDGKDSDSNGGERIAAKEVQYKRNAVFEVRGVPMLCTRKVENMMTSILSHKADHVNL